MKFLTILTLLYTPLTLASLFSADHKFAKEKKCVVSLPEIKKRHSIVCAYHKKKKELNFCEGDIVMLKYSSSHQHVFAIKNEMVYADDVMANRGTRTHTDKVTKVIKRFSCKDRKSYLIKQKTSVIRAQYNPNYWPKN